ncbi:MAG: thioredoxin family protein [Bacteroidota bacterium]
MRTHKFFYLLLMSLLLYYLPVHAEDTIPGFFSGKFSAALEKAKHEKKILMVDFYAVWCKPCKMLEEQVYRQDFFKPYTEKNGLHEDRH